MEKILITGVAGFIGSNLAKKLIQKNYKVVGIDNFTYGNASNIQSLAKHKNFEFIEGNLANYNHIKNKNVDILVHLASQKIPRYSNSYKTIEDNSLLTDIVIKKCLNDKVKLVFASTSDIYGKNPQVPYNEESNMVLGATTVKRWAYAVSKIHSEHKIIANGDELGLQYTIMRFFGSYGINQNLTWWGGPQSVFIAKALKNDILELHGDGKQTRTFTYVDDTVQGIIKCMFHKNSTNDIFNIGTEPTAEISIKDLAKLIWKLIRPDDKHPKIKYIPYASFGKYEDVRRRVPDISKIKKLLGYKPVWKIEEGLRKTITWQKSIS